MDFTKAELKDDPRVEGRGKENTRSIWEKNHLCIGPKIESMKY